MANLRARSVVRSMVLLTAGGLTVSPTPAVAQDHSDMHDGEAVPVLVSTEWLQEHMDHSDLVLLHVVMGHDRTPDEGIAGAGVLDYMSVVAMEKDGLRVQFKDVDEMASAFAAAGVSNNSHVVLYGSPAHIPARMYVALDYLGHGDRTSVLDGDASVWQSEGRSMSGTFSTHSAATFVPNPRDDVLVTIDWLLDRVDDPNVAFVDARPLEEYTGERAGDLRPGHIPGAYQLYWPELQESEDHPVLRALEEVQARYDEAGAPDADVVVSYCLIGMRASYTYLVSKHLGYDTRFYDGSWNEWGGRDDTPVVAGASRR